MPSDKIKISCGVLSIDEPLENRQPFTGILCTLNAASVKAPLSNIGKRAVITEESARKALASIEGQPVNVAWNNPDGKFSGHDKTVVGIFSKGWIQDGDLWVSGYLFNETFPQICASIKQEKNDLGFSYEILAKSYKTNGDEMLIDDFTFIGGTILYKTKAAYGEETQLVAAQAKENDKMTTEEIQGIIAGINAGFDEKFEKISASIDQKIKEGIEGVSKDVEEIKASALKSKEDMEALAVNLAEAKEKIEAAAVELTPIQSAEPVVEPVKAAADIPVPTVLAAGQQVVLDKANEPAKGKPELIKAAKADLRAGKINMNEYMHEVVKINAGIAE